MFFFCKIKPHFQGLGILSSQTFRLFLNPWTSFMSYEVIITICFYKRNHVNTKSNENLKTGNFWIQKTE